MESKPVEILLVEDNPNDVELTLHAFKRSKITNRIFVVHDGEEALEFLFRRGRYQDRVESDQPKIVLLDLKLPKLDGLEVLKAIKKDPVTQSIPVIVLTSSQHEHDVVESYRLGVNSYIRKPVDFDQFIEVVREMGYYWLLLNIPSNR